MRNLTKQRATHLCLKRNMRKRQAQCQNMLLSIQTNDVKLLLKHFCLIIVTHLFFALTSVTFFCILRLNIFKGTAKSLVFVVENGDF